MPIPQNISDFQAILELMRFTFEKRGIKFSKAMAAKIVGGESRLETLVQQGKVRMDKPTDKQNGKWFCHGGDVIRQIKF